MTTIDWGRFARRSWEKSAFLAAGAAPEISRSVIFETIVAACAPFRSGTLFYAMPEVRFFVGHAQVRSPGRLLPTRRDGEIAAYVARVLSKVGEEGFQLAIEHPLFLDYALWTRVRAFVRPLFDRLGFPVAPVSVELTIGTSAVSPRGLTKRRDHAVFALVLEGRIRTKVWPEAWGGAVNEATDFAAHDDAAETFDLGAGDVLYTPSHAWSVTESESAVVLRISVPVAAAAATRAVNEPLLMALADEVDETDVPYLTYPPRRRRSGEADAVVTPFVRVAKLVEGLTRSENLEDTLRVLWSKRVSACALEPVPPLRAKRRLARRTVVRLRADSPVVRMDFEPPTALWAVNGHAFAVSEDEETLRVLGALRDHRPWRVDDLGSARAIHVLLDALYTRRALEIVDGAPT